MELKKYVDVLTLHAEKHKRPYEMALNDFLDYLLEFFDVKALGESVPYEEHVRTLSNEEPEFTGIMLSWLQDVAKAMNNGKWLDLFGEIYESVYLMKSKAAKTGQFFTPHSISDLCAQMLKNDKKEGLVNDCAAGSGRLLLAHFMEATKEDHAKRFDFRYIAQDSDVIACKMCALNLMAHGMNARVICQNTLSMSTPPVVYHINEVRYPFPTPYYSVRAEVKR